MSAMPRLRVKTLVPGSPDQVYEHVTAFSTSGQVDDNVLETKYGKLLERQGNTLMFLEDIGGGVKWQCTFEPPNQRIMRALDSTWSDRIDQFEPTDGGTLWTITWELKAHGLPAYTKWLAFHLKDKRHVYQRLVLPVVSHFQGAGPET